jgi:hypothetical protein
MATLFISHDLPNLHAVEQTPSPTRDPSHGSVTLSPKSINSKILQLSRRFCPSLSGADPNYNVQVVQPRCPAHRSGAVWS